MNAIEARFWCKVNILSENECWEWLAFLDSCGYGHIKIDGKSQLAHRVSYEINVGLIGDLCVLHHCDNPSCVNPNHLFLGTHADNMVDMCEKGRVSIVSRTGYRKLSQRQIKEIRRKYVPFIYTQEQLAEEYAVGHATISNIVQYKGAYK